jgi:tRNA A37 methylthiotransferase MiaB
MPDILLIQPPIEDFYLTAKRTMPYGLACIASVLINKGFSVEIFDALASPKTRQLPIPPEMAFLAPYYEKSDISPFALFHGFKHFGYSFEHIGRVAQASGAFLIGISSLFTAYSNEAIRTAETVRQYCPEAKIVMGGHHPTAMPESVMQCKAIDFVLRGDGEVSMPLIAEAIRNGKNPASVPGIVFRKPDGSLHISEPALMKNLDDYPLPASELIHHKFYHRGKGQSAVITASRGCPKSCSYCCMAGVKYRKRSIGSVLAEIERAVVQYGVRFIDIEDENISLDRTWFLTLLHEIQTRFSGYELEFRAMNGLFPPSLDEDIIYQMKHAGFKTLNLSLGTANPEQQQRFGRRDMRQSLENALKFAEKCELEAVSYIIIGAPGQRAEDSLNDLRYLAKLNTIVGVSVFYPAPGSADFKRCEQLGILPEHLSLMRSSALPLSHTTTRLEILTLLRLGRILNFMKLLKKEESSGNIRHELGKKFLDEFLHDGRIRGMTREGEVFEHEVSTNLTEAFIREIPG